MGWDVGYAGPVMRVIMRVLPALAGCGPGVGRFRARRPECEDSRILEV